MQKKPILYENIKEYKVNFDFILALSCPLFVSMFFYGIRPLILVIFSFCTYTLVDFVSIKIRRQSIEYFNIYNLKYSMIFVSLLPASIPYSIVFLGCLVSGLFCKVFFGSYKSSIFNPAVTGFCFLAISFTNQVYSYPAPFTKVPIFFSGNYDLVKSGLFSLKEYGVPYVATDDLLLGNYAGPLATSYLLVIISVYVFLIVRKTITWHLPVTFISTTIIFAFLFPRLNTDNIDSVIYEVFFQPMMYIALFIVSDFSTSPVKDESKIFYGFSLGVLSMLFEYNSPYVMASLFAVVLLNPMAEYYDRVITPAFIEFNLEKYLRDFKERYLEKSINILSKKSSISSITNGDSLIADKVDSIINSSLKDIEKDDNEIKEEVVETVKINNSSTHKTKKRKKRKRR